MRREVLKPCTGGLSVHSPIRPYLRRNQRQFQRQSADAGIPELSTCALLCLAFSFVSSPSHEDAVAVADDRLIVIERNHLIP